MRGAAMTDARAHIGASLALIGILIAADTLLLLYVARGVFPSEILGRTAIYFLLQEAFLFGVLVFIALKAGRSTVALPIHLGYLTVIATCSLVTIVVVLIYDLLLMFGWIDASGFWI